MIADPKILILEDNQSDADLLLRQLRRSGLNFTFELVQTRAAFELSLLNFAPDIILSDYSMPSFDAASAFDIKQQSYPNIPFIIVSGFIGEENVVELIKNGVTDYVSKNTLVSLDAKIRRALKDSAIQREKIITDERLKTQTAELISLNADLEERVINRTRALAESEHRFRDMMETIPQIAWTNTTAGTVNFFNQRWYDYTGLDPEKENWDITVFIHPDDMQKSLDQFRLIRKANSGGEFQVRGRRADGTYRWHLLRLMPIKNKAGDMQLWVGTATDIQELRLLQQQKDDFISIASHELRTPMTSLKATLQMLDRIKHKASTPILPTLIEQANKSSDKVNVLIEDLLNASKANEGQLNIKPKRFTLFKVLEDCCVLIKADDFTITVTGDRNAEVYADAGRIEQVVVNLINNAMKYANGSTEIRVNIQSTDRMLKVSVIDRGPGIAPEKLRYLFDRYYRVDNSGSRYTGLGIGLYICTEIIRNHSGEIGVDSEVGHGSTFWFTLPVFTAEAVVA
jgi:PAS domain S-box-containing protein